MSVRYRFDAARSQFAVQAFATGLLSALGHSPTFSVRDYSGDVRFVGGEVSGLELEMTVKAASLVLLDRISETDRREIERRMRDEVLETAPYPEIAYRASHLEHDRIAPGRYRIRIGGPLSLHGVTRPHNVEVELSLFEDGIRLLGEDRLRLSDYGIRPVTALAGAIKLKDELKVSFDIGAGVEES